jgi:hypothetical protein
MVCTRLISGVNVVILLVAFYNIPGKGYLLLYSTIYFMIRKYLQVQT